MESWRDKCVATTSGLLLAFGIYECGLGYAQLFGLCNPGHLLFPATGTFFNPGPFCGFLAMLMPVALYFFWKKGGVLKWISAIFLFGAVALMPVLMGRTGWIAAIIGCYSVYIAVNHLSISLKKIIIGFMILLALLAAMYVLKPESALGRLFIWRLGIDAILDHPLLGTGWDYVGGALGDMQERYFAEKPDSIFIGVVGSPQYPFNEYIQIAIAYGIPCLLGFVALLSYGIYSAWKEGRYGVMGGIIAFCIVAFSSYPLQFPEFIAAIAILLLDSFLSARHRSINNILLPLLVISIALPASIRMAEYRYADKKWREKAQFMPSPINNDNLGVYEKMEGKLKSNGRFLFDYGKALRASGEFQKSTEVLQEGLKVSSDPMFLNLIGRNYNDLGQYALAEKYFLRSINRLPDRLYPYFLLAQLYASREYFKPDKLNDICDKALCIKPKVESPATRKMKKELQKFISN